MEKFVVNIDRYGNTAAASVPIALDELNRSGKLKRGDTVLLCSLIPTRIRRSESY
ncbi:MAG: hypothetical protein E7672_07870 [Ruminococcaceae bacterium]|nr:hypothetical protein [Oscillospiraceae bacterium]